MFRRMFYRLQDVNFLALLLFLNHLIALCLLFNLVNFLFFKRF